MWILTDVNKNVITESVTKASIVYKRYDAKRIVKGVYSVKELPLADPDKMEGFPKEGWLYGSKELAEKHGCCDCSQDAESESKVNLGCISVDVQRLSDGTFDVWISTESSSGSHYESVSADDVGTYVADLIESLAENYQ